MPLTPREQALFAVGILGNICAFGMFFSPLPTFWKIIQRKETGEYSGVPYVATLLNCLIWTLYGSKEVADLVLVVSINVAGLIIETCYITIHLVYGNAHNRKKVAGLLMCVSILFLVICVSVIENVDPENRALIVGTICCVIGAMMYFSPLTVLTNVVRTKSVENMPFTLSAASLLNSMVWTSYGLIAEDKYIVIPNALGVLLCMVQLIVYAHYYKPADANTFAATGRTSSISKLDFPRERIATIQASDHL